MTQQEPTAGCTDRADPRIARTQTHVLEEARRLLAEQGAAGVNFSVLAKEARVSRQTLYRYWACPEQLVADLVRRRVPAPLGRPDALDEALRGFLCGLRQVLTDPAFSVAYGVLMAAAVHDPAVAVVLEEVMASRQDQLNAALGPLCAPLDDDAFSRLVGPLTYTHFLRRAPITDRLIEDVVAGFLCGTAR